MDTQSPVRVIIQSRLASTRLPGKALLPIGGTEFVSLVAQRAANAGHPVVVATSWEISDAPIVDVLTKKHIRVFRGPHDDVLERFRLACADLPERSLVVRLTADNVFPDGVFVAELLSESRKRNVPYLTVWSEKDGVPFGVFGEVFQIGALREAAAQATTPHDREHVGPWIYTKYGRKHFRPSWAEGNLSHLRCTVDTLADYQRVKGVFDSIEDPIHAPMAALCQKLFEQQEKAA